MSRVSGIDSKSTKRHLGGAFRTHGIFAAAAAVLALCTVPPIATAAVPATASVESARSNGAPPAGTSRVAAGEAGKAGQIDLALPYVPPPHVPGAKVRTPETIAPLLVARLAEERPVNVLMFASADDERAPLIEGAAANEDGAEIEDGAALDIRPAADGQGKNDLAERSTHADAFLLPVDVQLQEPRGAVVIPTGYRAGVMAIMRTDTDIRQWDDLRGRIVCLTEESGLAGELHERYGATEKVYRAPADALLDLRIGGCDATVHDSTMLQALLEFPEWEKFSARLPVQNMREWAFVLPEEDAALSNLFQSKAREWQDSGLLKKLTEQSARDIAFEVYMDQEVPDCH